MTDGTEKTNAEPAADSYGLKNDAGLFPLETIIESPDGEEAGAEAEAIEGEADESDAVDDDTDDIVDSDDVSSDTDDDSVDEDDDLSDLDDLEDDEDLAAEETDTSGKTVTFSDGDKNFEIPFDAQVTIPVDGEDIQVSFADLQKSYNGKGFYDRKVSETVKKEKQLEAERADLDRRQKEFDEGDKFLSEIAEKANNGDPYGALALIYEQSGLNTGNLLRNYLLQAKKTVQQIAEKGYTSEQLEAIIAKKTLEQERKKSETQKSTLDAKDREIELSNVRKETLKEKGYTEEQYNIAKEDLEKIGIKLAEMPPQEQVDRVVGEIESFYIPYTKVARIAKKKLSKENFDKLLEDSSTMESLVVLARTADNVKIWKTMRTLLGTIENGDTSSGKRDSSKKPAKKKQATSEKSAPLNTTDETPEYEGVFASIDDVVDALS